MGTYLRSLAIATVAAAAAIGCTVHQADAPPMTGPSTFALSVSLTATPDTIVQNGTDTSTLRVTARDANGRPIPNLGVSLQVTSNGKAVDTYGTLSASTIYTASDGSASATYTAPPAAPPSIGASTTGCHGLSGPCVTIVANPIGSNFENTYLNHPTADIRLAPPPAAQTDPSQPQALFTVSNSTPAVNDVISFNASTSRAGTGHTITSYSWDFGDGERKTGISTTHDFATAGSFMVTLTIANEAGQTSSITATLTVH